MKYIPFFIIIILLYMVISGFLNNYKIPDDAIRIRVIANSNSNYEQELKSRPPQRPRPPSAKKDDIKRPKKINQQRQGEFSMFSDTDELLNTLCEFCVKKNINLKRHLLRYDISKNGKISENDFKRAIEELKLGFINSDLDKLANTCKSQQNNDISIDSSSLL